VRCCEFNRRGCFCWSVPPGDTAAIAHLTQQAEQECSAIASAISRYRGELLAMPTNHEPFSDVEGPLNADTSPRQRRVLQRGRRTKGRAAVVFPRHFGRRPHHLSRFDRALIHANSIGAEAGKFSYE
jgi:hypothetical protein